MKKKIFRYLLIFSLPCWILSSCKVVQPYQVPEAETAGLYRETFQTDSFSIAELSWNQFFTDSALLVLIERGIAENPDLQMAYARLEQAEAYYRQTRAAFFPSLDANAGVNISKLSEAQGFGIRTSATQYQLGLSSSWEADIWGRLRSSRRASLANLLQTDAARKAVQTRLVADLANLYYNLLALDQQLAITNQTVANWDSTVSTMRALKVSARVTEAAVVQSEAQRYAAEVTIPDLKQSIRETENTISILLGQAPAAIARGSLQTAMPNRNLTTGVPALLMANRPDIIQAEQNFRYFFEMSNVARTFFYPSLIITGSTGLNALSFANIFDPASFVASIGAGLTQPVFNRRANRTRLEVALSQQREALLGFQNSLLNAGREVSDALSLHQHAIEKIAIRSNQMDALQKSVEYTQELLNNGFGNYVEIITARQSLLAAEIGDVNDRLQQFRATVNLYRALGGGWR